MLKELDVVFLLIGLIFLMFTLVSFLIQIKKKKGIISLILSLIFTFFAGYYIYMIIYLKPIEKKFENYSSIEKIIITPKLEKKEMKTNEIALVINLNGNSIKVNLDDEIEIKKNATFTISDIKGIDKENVKVNLVGFIGNPKVNDGQDIGYKINYKNIMKNKALDQKGEKYEIEIKKDDKKIGSVYIKFID